MATRPDAAAAQALAERVRRPVIVAFLDIKDEPIRVTDAPYSFDFSGTGDPDLDGYRFQAVDPRVVSVAEVKSKEGGSGTVQLSLSGLQGIDGELLTTIGDKSQWQRRTVRVWKAMLDPVTFLPRGAIWGYYTGYMQVPQIVGDQASQTIILEVESYLGFFERASNRSYIDQQSFDPADRSAELSIAIANQANRRR